MIPSVVKLSAPSPSAPEMVSSSLQVLFRKQWLPALLLAVVGVVVRMPALPGQLIWDDQFLARDNPFIKSPLLLLEAFRHHLFLDSYSAHYRPVQNISFFLDYFFWHTNAWGFHLTNVILHAGSGLLLYLLLLKIIPPLVTRQDGLSGNISGLSPVSSLLAWLVALLWTVHPVHSAAVDYISGRADSLAFFFACAAWLVVIAARSYKRRFVRLSLFLVSAMLALVALCSREIACVWVVIFLLHLFLFEKNRPLRSKIAGLLCCLTLLGAYAGLRQLPERRSGPGPSSSWSAPVRAVLMLRALGDYGRLMIFPANLHMERTVFDGQSYANGKSWRDSIQTEYLSVAGVAVLAALLAGAWHGANGRYLRIFGACWFLIAYLPVSNLFELNATCAEHWLYLPSVGFLLFLAGCAVALSRCYTRTLVASAFVAVICLGARSAVRSSDWLTPEIFYQRTLAAGGTSVRVGVNLGMIYSLRGDYEKAEKTFRAALQSAPDYPIARNNLADVLYRQGKVKEAEAIFAAASKDSLVDRTDYPRTWLAALNLAHLQHGDKEDDAALATLEKARAEYPFTWELISFEAELLRETKGPEEALRLVDAFARDTWWHYASSLAVGRLWAACGDVEKAYTALQHASRLDVHDAEALNLIASMRFRQNRFEEAYASQKRAAARQPHEPRQFILLSDILIKMGRTKEAKTALAQATQLRAIAEAQ